MSTKQLKLTIVSQERELLSTEVDSVTAPTTEGEVTILPGHIPLFSKLHTGEVIYRIGSQPTSIVISKGFIDVSPNDEIKVMVDAAVHEREISLEKAEAAVRAAQETMAEPTLSQRELIMVEASLRQALLEVKVAQRTKTGSQI
jgi:F-type H+-transporting ATPase subunit epsilon